MIEDKPIVADLQMAKEVLAELEKRKESSISYGTLAFWIMVVKKCEKVSDDISMQEFFNILTKKPDNRAEVKVREEVGGD